MQDEMLQKQELLFSHLRKLAGKKGLLIAFSGGVDSMMLAAAALRAALPRVELAFCNSPLQSRAELLAARAGAEELGLKLHVLELEPRLLPEVQMNQRERCYYCKRLIFSTLLELAKSLGLAALAEGANGDDLSIRRPGLRAGDELSVARPLAELGFSKAELRALARDWGLSCWEKAASPCLASRFPYDTELKDEMLRRVEAGEELLQKLGLQDFRLRCHGDLARIECLPEQLSLLLSFAGELCASLRQLGFAYITYDLEGFHSGSFDR
ncbi:MAG: ATP-dependent sacrificial sulfur transferase LarE [Bacillota bacterium]|nr:ATP-dependent sacrificial sulfur transferase LarE [Bacillota bacterium]